jgi:DNA-binding IscR family transcriptional regulator
LTPKIIATRISLHRVWEKAREQLRNTLREATFAKLLEDETCIFPLISSELSEENKTKEEIFDDYMIDPDGSL